VQNVALLKDTLISNEWKKKQLPIRFASSNSRKRDSKMNRTMEMMILTMMMAMIRQSYHYDST